MKFKESTLRQYAAPLSETENQKCIHAIEMVRDALRNLGFTDHGKSIAPLYSDTYAYALEMRSVSAEKKVTIFVQGSYANNTNVRTQSDVDVAVVQEDVFQTEYRISTNFSQCDEDYGFSPRTSTARQFKDDVQKCLTEKFGRDVERKDKSIKVHGNSYRKDADTVPCRRYRDYRGDYKKDRNNYVRGIVIVPDSGGSIINYPEQHIANGRAKNMATNHWYKKMVRIMKNMRHLMSDSGEHCAECVSSFGLESLLWNVPNDMFTQYTLYGFTFGNLVRYLYKNLGSLPKYKETNGIKPLCATQKEVDAYSAFITRLVLFFEYDLG